MYKNGYLPHVYMEDNMTLNLNNSISNITRSVKATKVVSNVIAFEQVNLHKKKQESTVELPRRSTAQSAGYDFISPEQVALEPGQHHLIWTDVKAKMPDGVVLKIYPRSSLGAKHGVILRNTVGIIDKDYYGNPTNDGNIGICLINTGSETFLINPGDKIAQGIFESFISISGDDAEGSRSGGFGSTGQ